MQMQTNYGFSSNQMSEYIYFEFVKSNKEKYPQLFFMKRFDWERLDEFFTEIKAEPFNGKIFDYRDLNDSIVIENEKFKMYQHMTRFTIILKEGVNFKPYHKLMLKYKIFQREEVPETSVITDYYYVNQIGQLRWHCFEESREDYKMIFPEMYPGLDIKRMVEVFSKSDEKLLILLGEPGLGKTTLIKYILKMWSEMDNKDVSNAYVKSEEILKKDEFWITIAESNYEFVVLDDLDFALKPRTKKDPNEFVSKLLSYTEGIFKTDEKIIITTNRDMREIDSALVRPGRCFDILELQPLQREMAKGIWVDSLMVSPQLFEEKFDRSLDTISQAHLMSEYNLINKKEIRDYLIDPRISVRNKYQAAKK